MRKSLIAIAFVCAGSLFAADPTVGTWKLDLNKYVSTAANALPKEGTLIIEVQGDALVVTSSGTFANGRKFINKFSGPPQGGPVKVIDSTFSAISFKNISPLIREITYSANGKEVIWEHSFVSEDGKTLCLVDRLLNAKGGFDERILVYERQ
jgi:hypothetical protein